MSTARVQTAAEALRQTRESAERLEAELRLEIQSALRDGIPATRIADAAGISRQRVYQIRDGKR